MLELRALGALAKATTLALLAIATPSAAIPWSQPAQLGRCTAGSPPLIAFPFSTPTVATGPGAIVWSAAASCRGAAGPRVVALGPDLQPGSERRLSSVANAVPSAIAAAPHGRIVVAARRGSGGAQLLEGRANGSFSPLAMSAAEPVGLATAYLGDTGLVTASAGGGLRVQVQRHDSTSFSPARKVLAGPSRAADAQVALDFRTDQLVVWRSGDELFARYLPVEGAAGPVRRLAHVKGVVRIAALLSDNGRATVAWSQRARGTVSVYLDRSAAGPDFGMPRLLERDREPHGVAAPSHSPLLVRVADESVMMAWAGVTSGRWVVRTAPIAETLGAVSTVEAPGEALLAGLATGPADEALLTWTVAVEPGAPASASEAVGIFAARGYDAHPHRTLFGTPERIASALPDGPVSAAIDPATDGAVAVWMDTGGKLLYSLHSLVTAGSATAAGRGRNA